VCGRALLQQGAAVVKAGHGALVLEVILQLRACGGDDAGHMQGCVLDVPDAG
jgi:hypothetical protein